MVTLTPDELQQMRNEIDRGHLPPDAIKKHFEAEARNVFGWDAKKDSKGNYIEQGIGAKGNESANHYAALRRSEELGLEPPGTYQAALAEIWKRDPKTAEKLRLPKPRVAA